MPWIKNIKKTIISIQSHYIISFFFCQPMLPRMIFDIIRYKKIGGINPVEYIVLFKGQAGFNPCLAHHESNFFRQGLKLWGPLKVDGDQK